MRRDTYLEVRKTTPAEYALILDIRFGGPSMRSSLGAKIILESLDDISTCTCLGKIAH